MRDGTLPVGWLRRRPSVPRRAAQQRLPCANSSAYNAGYPSLTGSPRSRLVPTASRDELHDLIERLPDSELHAVQLFLQFVHSQARLGGRSGLTFTGRRSSDDQVVVVDAKPNDPVALASPTHQTMMSPVRPKKMPPRKRTGRHIGAVNTSRTRKFGARLAGDTRDSLAPGCSCGNSRAEASGPRRVSTDRLGHRSVHEDWSGRREANHRAARRIPPPCGRLANPLYT